MPDPAQEFQVIKVKVTYYWPPLGGINCADFQNGVCLSAMASGERWEDWVEQAIACPPEWPFGTRLEIEGHIWTCMDTGSAIVFEGGIPHIDLLTPNPPPFVGTVVEAKLYQSLLTVKQ